MATDDDDPKVKQILDSATQADLERWFSLPSFQQVAEQKPEPSAAEADMAAVMERREQAIAAVDPKLLGAIYARADRKPDDVTVSRWTLDVQIANLSKLDETLVANLSAVAKPRDYRRPDDITDDLKDRAP